MLQDGYTLMHEHVTIDLSGVKKDPDCRLDCFEETVEEFKELYRHGVRNVLEVTNIGMGRYFLYRKSSPGDRNSFHYFHWLLQGTFSAADGI